MGVVVMRDDGMQPMELDVMEPRAMQPWCRKRPRAAHSPTFLAVLAATSVHDETKPAQKRPALSRCASWPPAKRQRVATSSSSTSSTKPSLGSPRSLQFALSGLSSLATQRVLHSLRALPSELRHLNGSAPQFNALDRRVHCVFGWRHVLWPEDEHTPSSRVVWKSAKALETMRMRPLARQLWSERVGQRQVLHTISDVARVVRCPLIRSHSRFQNDSQSQVWVECFLDDGRQVCVARKELCGLDETPVEVATATAECQGFLIRPVYARTSSAAAVGCTVQSLRAVHCGSSSHRATQRQLVEDLPWFTLQWEDAHLTELRSASVTLFDDVLSS